MRRHIFLAGMLLMACVGSVEAATGEPLIDPEWKVTENSMKSAEISQCKHLSLAQGFACKRHVREDYEARGVVPGTMPYVQKRYGGMSVQQLDDEIRQINRTYGRARMIGSYDHPLPGEITYDMQQDTVNYLRQLINSKGGMPPLMDLRGSR